MGSSTDSGKYWRERLLALEEEQYQRSEAYQKDLQEQFRRAKNEIQMDIERWYWRLAENNGISLAAAKRLLRKKELEEFQWTVEQYIKYGEINGFDPKWRKQLENASARHHISYLEALKCQMQQHVELLMTEYEGGVTDFLHKTYTENYYHSAYEIAKGTGVGSNLAQLDEKSIHTIIKKPWAQDGKNFSERIWTNKQKLTSNLHTELSQCIIRGEEPAKAICHLAEIMDVSERQAGRLVMTEAAAISSVAKKDCFQELDVEEFQFVATLDRHTSKLCQSMDGKHFKMSDYQIGVNVPPLHCWCRSCTVPYFGDEFTEGEQRAARDEEGKTYYVPADMIYSEWKEKFIDNEKKSVLEQKEQREDEKIKKAREEFTHILLDSESTPHNNKMILYSQATEYQLNEKLKAPFAYNISLDVIQYNPNAPNYQLYDINIVQVHELSHRMDELEYHSWENKKFQQAIETTKEKIYNNIDEIRMWFLEGGKYDDDMALSDIFSALSEGDLNEILYSGHPVEYWKGSNKKVCMEIFANIASIDILDCKSKEEFGGILRELYEAYKELIQ